MFAFIATTLVALLGCTSAAIVADQITSLPGWAGPLPSKQYSGYVNIGTSGKYMHYWFVEAETAPATAPVVLWLNGGPGCSSLDGYMYEQGPFHVNEANQSQLLYNEYTWAKQVNIVFLESPVGVGFSYSMTPSDYTTNDTQTANDNFDFLNGFFKGFSELATNDFYIAGESYAGVYVPTLAARVLAGNAAGESDIPLKGIAVGNGCTGNDVGVCGGTDGTKINKDFLFWHGLVSIDLSNQLDAACGDYTNPSADCLLLLGEMGNGIGDVNIYDIYQPCINGGMTREEAVKHTRARVPARPVDAVMSAAGTSLRGPDECIDGIAAAAYLNTVQAQKAINVVAASKYYGEWTICSSKINYSSTASNLPGLVYPGLLKQIRVLIFNGDVDACVPYNDNQIWTSGMAVAQSYPVTAAWHPWMLENQVAGYATAYSIPNSALPNPFTFITIKGSGHMVPQYQPAVASEMLRRFINHLPF